MQRPWNSATSNQTIVCPWCGTVYQQYQPNCSNCGGVLPNRSQSSAGQPPPSPPRQLPKEFERRVRNSHQFQFLFGGIFAAVGTILGVSFLTIGLAAGPLVFPILGTVFLLVFGGIGYGVLISGIRSSRAKLKALSEGVSTTGTIDEIYEDNTIQVNGRSPWKVTYSFTANGARQANSQHMWHPDYSLEPGFPVYVVYLAQDPGENSIYPPLP